MVAHLLEGVRELLELRLGQAFGEVTADPVAVLEAQAASRVQELVPIRYGRMLASPFTFFRGAAYLILTSDPKSTTGNFFIDDEQLARHGITDLEPYSVTPGTTDFIPDFFVD